MRVLWFDCFAGVSGDMILGALVGAGLDVDSWLADLRRLPVPFEVEVASTTRAGLACTRVHVRADEGPTHRRLADVVEIVEGAALPAEVRRDAIRVFERLAAAEAAVHGTTIDAVAFHEVGAVDAIVDVVGAVSGLARLAPSAVIASPIALGRHHAKTAHGEIPTPAPATLELMRDVPAVWTDVAAELATPTGVAILTTLARFGSPPAGTVGAVGYGAGARDLDGRPNALRAVWIETASAGADEAVWLLEANVDDMSPEHVGAVFSPLLETGALDVWTTAVTMKKGRPGLRLSVLAHAWDRDRLVDVVLRQTSTFGVRFSRVERNVLDRESVTVDTAWGPVSVKVGRRGDAVYQVAPEHEDVARAAATHRVSIGEVAGAARQAWRDGLRTE